MSRFSSRRKDDIFAIVDSQEELVRRFLLLSNKIDVLMQFKPIVEQIVRNQTDILAHMQAVRAFKPIAEGIARNQMDILAHMRAKQARPHARLRSVISIVRWYLSSILECLSVR